MSATLRRRINAALNGRDPGVGRVVAFAVQGIILVSVLALAVETVPGLPVAAVALLRAIEVMTISLFAAEYLLRLYAAPDRLSYVFSPFGVVDIIAILPSLLVFAGYDLGAFAALRALRFLLLFKLLRYTKALNRLARALRVVLPELLVFAAVAVVVLFLCAFGIYLFEHEAQPEAFASVFHAMWWAVVTFTTVGYGDVYPITTGGKIFTSLILILALGVVAVPTGLLTSALTAERPFRSDQDEDLPPSGRGR